MTHINTQAFLKGTNEIVTKFKQTQMDNMLKASEVCAKAMMNGGVVHVFGSGHSVGVGYELIGRPGSLVPFHQIFTSDFVTRGLVTLEVFKDETDRFERKPGIADQLYDMYPVSEHDVFIIISNSGINGLVIDLAQKAKQENHPVIVLTSLEHTMAEPSRHPSGKKLMDFGDIVIDNCGPRGDAMLDIPGGGKIGSISSIIGILIAQGLTAQIVEIMHDHNYEAPVLRVEDNEAAIAFNQKIKKQYEGRVS